jgi:hypothetical protein
MRSMARGRFLLLITVAGLLGWSSTAAAQVQVPIPLTVTGNQATGSVEVLGIGVDLTITFEQQTGLTSDSLAASVTVVDPLDPLLLLRLPNPLAMTIPVSFPLLIRVEPTPSSTLSFTGVATVSLYTHALVLDLDLPLSLLWGPINGPLRDQMAFESSGSYRAGASGPGLSEFLIVLDLRLINGVITSKFNSLQAALTQHGGSIPPLVRLDLQARLTAARAAYQAGALAAAIAQMTGFEAVVIAHSGSGIPNVWTAHQNLVNVAGILRTGAQTLKFSLNRKAAAAP